METVSLDVNLSRVLIIQVNKLSSIDDRGQTNLVTALARLYVLTLDLDL